MTQPPSIQHEQARESYPRLRWRTALPLLVLLAVGVHALLPRVATLEASAAVVRTLRWWPLALAVVAQVASYVANGYTVRAVARLTGDRLSLARGIAISLAAGSVGLLAGGPVGYAAATHHWMRGSGHSEEGAILTGWLPGLLNIGALTAIGLLGLLAVAAQHALTDSQLRSIAIALLAAVAIVACIGWMLSDERRLPALAVRVRRLSSRVRRRSPDESAIAEMVNRISSAQRALRRGGWWAPALGAMLNAVFDVLTLEALFLAAHHTPSIPTLLAGYGLPQVVGRLAFLLPGGVGIVEGGMVSVFAALGVHTPTAVLVVLAYRGLSFWLPTLVGFPVAAVLQRSKGGRRR